MSRMFARLRTLNYGEEQRSINTTSTGLHQTTVDDATPLGLCNFFHVFPG